VSGTGHRGRLAVGLMLASGLFASAAQARTDTPSVHVEQAGTMQAAAVGDARELVVSTASNRSRPVPLDGQSFAGKIYIFVPSDPAITQVRFFLDDPSMSGAPRRTDTVDPWDFAGGTATAATAFDVRTLAAGGHTVTAAIDETGGTTQIASASFTVVAGSQLLAGVSPLRADAPPLEGQTVNGSIYVFALSDVAVSQVRFFLDDPTMSGLPRLVETVGPYDFAGTAGNGNANPFNTVILSGGSHTITAAIDLTAGGTRVVTSTFDVLHTLAFSPPSLTFSGTEGGSVPSQTTSLAAADGPSAAVTITDDAPWLSVSPPSGSTTLTVTVSPDASGLATGTHTATVTASAPGHQPATLPVTVTIGTDSTPPAAPANVVASAGDAAATLTWSANTESDLAGYNVYRDTSLPVATTTPLNGSTLISSTSFPDTGLVNGTTYHYVVEAVDTSGNKAAAPFVDATPQAGSTALDIKVNFQSETAPVPTGFLRDFGEPFGARTGANQGSGQTYGWVVPGTHTPVSLVGLGRDRNLISDQKLDTFIHMQLSGSPEGAWEINVPNGAYNVTASVGESGTARDSRHRINIEGQVAIFDFVPTATVKFASVTRTVNVADGTLTIDPLGGTNTKLDYVTLVTDDAAMNRPSVTSTDPANGATDVRRDAPVTAEVRLPNVGYGIDEATLTSSTVTLTRTSDGAEIPANRNTSGGGDVIVLQPLDRLAENTTYRFDVTDGVKDLSGAPFIPHTSTFTTGTAGGTLPSSIVFDQVALANATGRSFTSLAIGPDHKLYAATMDGEIVRFPLNADGTTGTPEILSGLVTAEGGPRTIIGLVFDPGATAANPVLWVSHGVATFNNAPDWTGKISRLSGANLDTVQDFVVGLPRSIRDHMTNSLAFGPDGALYVAQGSNSAMGSPDSAWGNRLEHVLNAAVLRIDVGAISSPPLDVKTGDGGTYDPFAAAAPLTIYASGLRNSYDLVWHSNGQLYVPTNGSAAGGNTPATPSPLPSSCTSRVDGGTNGAYTGPSVPGLTFVQSAQSDFLFRVMKNGFYGHPNPSRCEWVMNGGNPTSAKDPGQVGAYPEGTLPDRNWRGAAYDFGLHYSPDGAIEYKGGVFGGLLDGKLMVARYSAGDDIIVLTPGGPNLNIVDAQTGITGLTGFVDPLDLTEDNSTGFLYVSELGAGRITLLRPNDVEGATLGIDRSRLVFNDVQAGGTSPSQFVTIENRGDQNLTVTSLTIGGVNPGQFQITRQPPLPVTLLPGASFEVGVAMGATTVGTKSALLQIASNDGTAPVTDVKLRGLGTLGTGGANEPSLQWILDTWEIPVNVGDPDPTNAALPTSALLGDEVSAQKFRKAGSGPVSIEPLAVFGPQSTVGNVLRFGWYSAGSKNWRQELFTVPNPSFQSVHPATSGDLQFDPGGNRFGFYSMWPFFSNRQVFGEDFLNTFAGALPHHVRVYPLKAAGGTVVADSYVVAFEETTSGTDYQDIVFIVRNVQPVPAASPQLEVENTDGAPLRDRLVFSRIGSFTTPPTYGVHDRTTLRLRNGGASPLTVNALTFSGPWALTTPVAVPATLAPGATLDVPVLFTASSGAVANGSLTIQSDDPAGPKVVALAGYWQIVSEGGKEPTLAFLLKVFGYTTVLTSGTQKLNEAGLIHAVGDEVLSPYWRRADTSRPVSVRQLAAYHTQGNVAVLRWNAKGSTAATQIFTSKGDNAQTVLPIAANTSPPAFAAASFTPSASAFGFKIDGEWSDDALNDQVPDTANGCPGPCGHHVRFWPVRDQSSRIVPDTWLMAMDYAGINYDYNDNVYLISNVSPADAALTPGNALARIDVAGSANFTDTVGHVWKPDTGLFSPPTAIDEGATVTPLEIAGTDNDVIYRTYRGNVGAVPVSERVLRYEIPVTGAGTYDVRLHLAERCSCDGAVGRRKFDVEAEKRLVADDVDIFSASGALNTAYSLPLSGIPVSDGSLSLTLRTVSDYVSIAGIEVFCQGLCVGGSGDVTSPAAPTNVKAVAGDGKVALTWDANSEPDFAGYKVYRSTSPTVSTSGTARSGSTLLTSPQFTDTATNGTTYFYVVQAVDSSGNKATSATVSATPRNASVVALRVNFQSDTAAVPTGYLRDFGEAYGPRTGTNQGSGETYGWVAPGTSTGRSMVGFGRDRNLVSDQRLDTHMQMQPAGSNPGAWEIAVPNGTYTVTVAVGDAAAVFTSTHRINAEGQNIIAGFTPTTGNRFATASGTATVTDGKMTIDANGGTMTMIDYVWIAGNDGTAPTTPAAFAAIESQTDGVVLDWNDNTQKDLGGYNIYRSPSSTGPFTKLNSEPVPGSFFQDVGTPAGSFYQVSAVDVGYHESARTPATATTPAAPDSTRIAWQNFATSPVTRHEAAGIAVNGKLYAFGGFSAGNTPCGGLTGSCITKVSHVYNPATNAWSRIADMPEGVTHAGIASDGTAVYVAGGYLGIRPDATQTFGTDHVWRYDLAANTWSSMPALPQARGSGNLAIIGRTLHFFGGADLSRVDRKEHWTLNLDGGTSWAVAASMVDAATHRGSAVIGGKIYAVGGQKGVDAKAITQRTLQVWDPASPGAWTLLAPLPALTGGTGRSHIAAGTFAMNGRLMVVGGDRAYFTPIANVTSYDPATNTWKEHTPLPLKRDSAIAAAINGTLFVTTGASSNTSYKGIPTDPGTAALASNTITSGASSSNVLLGTSGGSSTDHQTRSTAAALCILDPTRAKTVADHRPVKQHRPPSA
jgi:hypothetical protein